MQDEEYARAVNELKGHLDAKYFLSYGVFADKFQG